MSGCVCCGGSSYVLQVLGKQYFLGPLRSNINKIRHFVFFHTLFFFSLCKGVGGVCVPKRRDCYHVTVKPATSEAGIIISIDSFNSLPQGNLLRTGK